MYEQSLLQVRLHPSQSPPRLAISLPSRFVSVDNNADSAPARWPVIVAIIIAVVVAVFTLYCCLRCCGCCGGRRGARRSRKNTQPSMFNPLPYQVQGYQPANQPPPYGNQPPQFAQFDAPSQPYGPTRKIGEDSLPAMPSWNQAQSRKIEEDDVEMGHIDLQKNGLMNNASSADVSHGPHGYSEVENHPVKENYTGPDFGAVDTSYGGAGAGAAQHPYTGPDFTAPKAYAPYAPSESTRYEPSGVNHPQELGTTLQQHPPTTQPVGATNWIPTRGAECSAGRTGPRSQRSGL